MILNVAGVIPPKESSTFFPRTLTKNPCLAVAPPPPFNPATLLLAIACGNFIFVQYLKTWCYMQAVSLLQHHSTGFPKGGKKEKKNAAPCG